MFLHRILQSSQKCISMRTGMIRTFKSFTNSPSSKPGFILCDNVEDLKLPKNRLLSRKAFEATVTSSTTSKATTTTISKALEEIEPLNIPESLQKLLNTTGNTSRPLLSNCRKFEDIDHFVSFYENQEPLNPLQILQIRSASNLLPPPALDLKALTRSTEETLKETAELSESNTLSEYLASGEELGEGGGSTTTADESIIECANVLKKRRRRMRGHKHKKRLKKNRHKTK